MQSERVIVTTVYGLRVHKMISVYNFTTSMLHSHHYMQDTTLWKKSWLFAKWLGHNKNEARFHRVWKEALQLFILAINPSSHHCCNRITWCKTLHCGRNPECAGYNNSRAMARWRSFNKDKKCNPRGWLGYLGGWMSAMVHMVLMLVGCNDGRHGHRCDVPYNKEMGMMMGMMGMMGVNVASVGDRAT